MASALRWEPPPISFSPLFSRYSQHHNHPTCYLKFVQQKFSLTPQCVIRLSYFSSNNTATSSTFPTVVCAAGESVEPASVTPPSHDAVISVEGIKDRRKVVRLAWEKLVRWSRSWRSKAKTDVLERTKKVGLFF